MSGITTIEYVDYGVNGEYGFFGKVVAKSDVRGKVAEEIMVEIREMKDMLGEHVAWRAIEEIPAA